MSKTSTSLVPISETAFGQSKAAGSLKRWRLSNDLRVVTLVDKSAPLVSFHSWFRVGSRDEIGGKTGLAHLLEHLMFNETTNHSLGEFDRKMEKAGAQCNAATWTDWTYYHEELPKEALLDAMKLEADRMQNLVVRKRQIDSEKEVVISERRDTVDDDPDGLASETLWARALPKSHPYQAPTIGWLEDIRSFTVADVKKFYKKYYSPNNAVLVAVGDFDEKKFLRQVQRLYGKMPRAKLPKRPRCVADFPTSHTKIELPTQNERLLVAYPCGGYGTAEFPIANVIDEVLVGGRSARLVRELVVEQEIAQSVRGGIAPFELNSLYDLAVEMRSGKRASSALKLVDKAMRRLCKDGVSEEELEMARNRLELRFLEDFETAAGKAERLGFMETVTGSCSNYFEMLERIQAVTADDVVTVAKKMFSKKKQTTLTVVPKKTSR